jgi:aminoglycoside phosphotransferase (APT) family kinase protein
MHADEEVVDEELAARLVASAFPEWAALPLTPVEPWGTDNALYRLGEDKVLRLPRRARDALTLQKEFEWLPQLAPHLPLAIPVPLARAEPTEAYPFHWAVYGWLDGEPATDAPAEKGQAAGDVGDFIAALQAVDSAGGPPPGDHNVGRGEPVRNRDARVRESIEELRGEIDAATAMEAWERALDAPDWDGPPLWIHGDLDRRNLLVSGGRISGVLDFGCLGVGDPACDLMAAWKLGSPALFRTALEADDATWERARGWALSQAVNALSYYTLETNPTLVREARVWLAEIFSDDF